MRLDGAPQSVLLLTYTSEPLPAVTEITGHPVVTLFLAASTEDAALHVYLEGVGPGGVFMPRLSA
ncbi:MAG: CocE/NonD family hydrolase C-terminal non-catalytic domain-containing protein [Gammaproteobacteria bacterium]